MKTADIEVSLIHSVGSDLTVVNAARVSFDKESDWEYPGHEVIKNSGIADYRNMKLSKRDCGLISYLAKHKHHSPFNHAFLSFRVKAPIFVARQLVKHKFMPWNEVSRRYVEEEPEFYIPEYWRKKADDVKQGSGEESVALPLNYAEAIAEGCSKTYTLMLEQGVCPEQARMVLPQNMMTTWYWSGTLGAFLDMLKLRLDPHTQKETREVAEKIYEEVKHLFPVSTEAYLANE